MLSQYVVIVNKNFCNVCSCCRCFVVTIIYHVVYVLSTLFCYQIINCLIQLKAMVNDKTQFETISDIAQTYVLLRQSRSDFIEHLFYLKRMYNIYLLYTVLPNRGQLKLTNRTGKSAAPIADSSTDLLQNFALSISSKSPTKPSKIPISPFQITYRTPYRQIPLKSSISAT